jgi:hypothetical protein
MQAPRRFAYGKDLWARHAAEWEQLVQRSHGESAFLSSAWMGAWWDSFGESLKPEIWRWTDRDGAPVAMAVVSLQRVRVGPVSILAASLNATGEDRIASEHNAIPCLPQHRDAVLRSLVDTLIAAKVDMLRLQGFATGDAEVLSAAWPKDGVRDGFSSEDRHVDLRALRQAGKTYLETLSRNSREQIRRSCRLYEQQHGPLKVQRLADGERRATAFAELRRLHDARWHARGDAGAFADIRSQTFHQHLAAAAGFTELVRVTAGEHCIAVLYNLLHAGRVNFYQSGIVYGDDARLKPGLVAHALAVQDYANAGFDEYDFLAGEPQSIRYKASLGTAVRQLVWQDLYRPTAKMRALDLLRRARRALRQRVQDLRRRSAA